MLPSQVNDWPEYWRQLYEERAGMMEYDGGLDRVTAEIRAEQVVRELQSLIPP